MKVNDCVKYYQHYFSLCTFQTLVIQLKIGAKEDHFTDLSQIVTKPEPLLVPSTNEVVNYFIMCSPVALKLLYILSIDL